MGEAEEVFSAANLDQYSSSISSVNNDCDLSESTTYYVKSEAKWYTKYSMTSMLANPNCTDILNPYEMGYDPKFDGDDFIFGVDMRTVMTILGVLYEVNGPETLTEYSIIENVTKGVYNGVEYQISSYFDDDLPEMDPMYCVGPVVGSVGDWNCFIKIGNSYLY